MSEFARGFVLGAMMVREQACAIADAEVLFAMGAGEGAGECHPDGTVVVLDLSTYWTLRLGVARLVADEIHNLQIPGE